MDRTDDLSPDVCYSPPVQKLVYDSGLIKARANNRQPGDQDKQVEKARSKSAGQTNRELDTMPGGELFSQQFGQGVRSSADDLDELVKRNIQEVLQAAQLADESSLSPLDVHAPTATASTSRTQLKRNPSQRVAAEPSPSASPAPLALSAVAAIAAPGGAGAGGGSSMLDVPGHAEATIRLHKARIRALEDDNGKLVKALADRDRSLAESLKEVKALRAEQQSWSKDKKTYEAQIERLQRKASEAEAALATKDSVAKEVTKESTRLDRERRAAEQEARARDVRLQRALEEVERYKATLNELRSQEREGKDVVRGDLSRLATENKKLERQRGELLVAFKKQLKLIDVLKRQKVHLEAARALQFSEAEFLQTLELGNV